MCRVTVGETAADEALQRLQQELEQLQLQQAGQGSSLPDFRGIPGCKGSGPRLFCGHVPKEATEDLVRAHFSRWGTVTDVYFPRHKKTLKRRPFCFVSFASSESAERALAESPLNICGIPIKNLTMVEDRDAYYRTKHANTRAALVQALQSIGSSANGQVGPDQFNNLAALLAMEGVTADAIMALLPQGTAMPASQMTSLLPGADRFSTGSMPNAFPSLLNSDVPSTAGLRMSAGAGMYNTLPSLDGRISQQNAAAYPQQQGMGYNAGGNGFGAPNAQALDLQLHQALLAQRMSLQQQGAPGAMQGPPSINAALLQQFGMPQMGGTGFAPPVPQYAPPPQLNAMQHQLFSGANNWAGMNGQQQPFGSANGSFSGASSSLGLPSMGLTHSGSSQQTRGSNNQSSLEDALAALSTLKAVQGTGIPDASRPSATPSAEILAGLGSSTFSSNSPALSASPVRSSSPPSETPQMPARTPGLELPNTGIWASSSK